MPANSFFSSPADEFYDELRRVPVEWWAGLEQKHFENWTWLDFWELSGHLDNRVHHLPEFAQNYISVATNSDIPQDTKKQFIDHVLAAPEKGYPSRGQSAPPVMETVESTDEYNIDVHTPRSGPL